VVRLWRRGWAPPIGHELVELGLVLGLTQTFKVVDEFLLLVFEAT
jgi:hypothetical protein